MMDSSMNNLRLNGIIIVAELQTFVCIAINLLLIAMVTLLTALLGMPVLWVVFMAVSQSHKMCFIAIQRKIK